MTLDPVQLTRQLIDIESTTYSEGAVGAFLAEFLSARDFSVEKMHVASKGEDGATTDRFNVYATVTGERPEVVFSTHMDTVPPYFGSSEDDEAIYGRGACDAKGIIAAQIAAVEQLRSGGVKAGMLFVVGEERDSKGAEVANLQPKGNRYLINGEPTDNRLGIASKGVLRAHTGPHEDDDASGYPEQGDSAIHKVIQALHNVREIKLPTEPGIGVSNLNIGLIEGGRAPNVIADKAVAQVMVRLVGPSDDTRAALEKAIAGLAEIEYTLEIPFMRFRTIEGMETMVAAFATDIPALTNWGEPLLLGPGSIHVAHTPDEKLAKRELLKAIDLYTEIASKLVA
jgi:acetylornithine deacetylase